MKILIELYRDFEIYFDRDEGKFECVITDDRKKESISFSAVKKFIDDYKNSNENACYSSSNISC